MVLERAPLPVRPGREAEFEAAFERARSIIAAVPGFRGLRLSRCVERPDRYLLLVDRGRLEDHTEGFRGSAGYTEWRRLRHGFYEPSPVVEHVEPVRELTVQAHDGDGQVGGLNGWTCPHGSRHRQQPDPGHRQQ